MEGRHGTERVKKKGQRNKKESLRANQPSCHKVQPAAGHQAPTELLTGVLQFRSPIVWGASTPEPYSTQAAICCPPPQSTGNVCLLPWQPDLLAPGEQVSVARRPPSDF